MEQGWLKMEKTDTHNSQRIWKIEAKLFKPFNRDVAPLKYRTEFTRISSKQWTKTLFWHYLQTSAPQTNFEAHLKHLKVLLK